jgi:16S rRNA (guanine966-N2)-methyltransferase
MRVIAGEAKGHRLFSVPGTSTRPITDRVKESLFNILGQRVLDVRFLDLFAGTGAVGIEALSRGAEEATFVESNPRAIATVRRNLEHTRLLDRAQVLRTDVFRYLSTFSEEAFDIVYVAPPQYRGLWAKTILAADVSTVVVTPALVIAQIHPKEYETLACTRLTLADQRTYGSTMLCFYELGE